MSTAYEQYYGIIARIPVGRVATYGQIAALAGRPGRARQVGYALAHLPRDFDVPWHRVINAKGQVSPRKHSGFHLMQRAMLEDEGVLFDRDRIDMKRHLWRPRGSVAQAPS